MKPKRPGGLSFYIILMIVIIAISMVMSQMNQPQGLALSEVEEQIATGKVDKVVLKGTSLEVTLKAEGGKAATTYQKAVSPHFVSDVYKMMQAARDAGKITSFDYVQPTDYGNILSSVMIVVLTIGMAAFIYFTYSRQSGDGKSAMSFGRSRAKLNDPAKNKVTFADVAGAEEEKEELMEIVDFLQNPRKYAELGAKIPRGILLVGAPGTGKTLLAKAVAGEAGVPFFTISGSDFVEMFVGVGASRVRDLFDNAKKQAPCIIFIDEIDAVGRHRGAGLGGGHDEREQTLNQLLVEMDGFGPNEGVIIMAATNRPDILDPALLRPGRFDRRITVMRPDLVGREEILKVHARNKPLDPSIDLKEIAKITPGFTGADLANLLNEAALLAARKNAQVILYEDISEAVFKVTIGPEKKSRIISGKERLLTAYHEAGHAIIIRAVSETDRVERVSIIPAGGAGGYTAFKPNEDMYFQTRQHLLTSIMVGLGGRAAEELMLNEISTGAASDLQHCNEVARDMITKYGMSEKLGNFVVSKDEEVFLGRDYGHKRSYSEHISRIIDEEVREILNEAYEQTMVILRENQVLLEELTQRLLDKEKIEGPEFEEIYRAHAVNFKPAPGAEEIGRSVSVAPPDPSDALSEPDVVPSPPEGSPADDSAPSAPQEPTPAAPEDPATP